MSSKAEQMDHETPIAQRGAVSKGVLSDNASSVYLLTVNGTPVRLRFTGGDSLNTRLAKAFNRMVD